MRIASFIIGGAAGAAAAVHQPGQGPPGKGDGRVESA